MGDLKDNGQHHPQIERFMALVTLDKMCSETKKNSGFPPKTRPFSEPWLPWLRHPQGARPADRDAGGQGPGGPRGAGARRAPSAALLPRRAAVGAAGAAGLERLGLGPGFAKKNWGITGDYHGIYWGFTIQNGTWGVIKIQISTLMGFNMVELNPC